MLVLCKLSGHNAYGNTPPTPVSTASAQAYGAGPNAAAASSCSSGAAASNFLGISFDETFNSEAKQERPDVQLRNGSGAHSRSVRKTIEKVPVAMSKAGEAKSRAQHQNKQQNQSKRRRSRPTEGRSLGVNK